MIIFLEFFVFFCEIIYITSTTYFEIKLAFRFFELPIVLGFISLRVVPIGSSFFSMHRLNLARRCVSKPPGPFGARRGQWASAGGAATLHVAYKLRQGRDVERTTAVTPMFSDLDKKTKGTA